MKTILTEFGFTFIEQKYIGDQFKIDGVWRQNEHDDDCLEFIERDGKIYRFIEPSDPHYSFIDFEIDTREKLIAAILLLS